MKKRICAIRVGLLINIFISTISAQHIGTPVGFANVPAYGVPQITGGKGGEMVMINGQADAKILQDALDDDDNPRIIYIQGTVQLPEYPAGTTVPVSDVTARMTCVRSNKTVLGLGKDAKILKSGFSIYSGDGENAPQEKAVKNIIIQNLTFEAAPDDAINIQGGSHHIWVDHCTFTDGAGGPLSEGNADGQLDFKRGSDYLTVSYCLFTNHNKMSLVGHSNSTGAIDKGFLRATYDHNFFNDLGGSASSRHPRVRFGIVHVLNCLIQGVGKDKNTEGVVSQCEANVFIEGCHYRFAKWGGSINEHTSGSETDGMLVEKNNSFDQCAKDFTFVKGANFNTADYFKYSYTPETSSSLPNTLPGKVGAGLLNIQKVLAETGLKKTGSSQRMLQLDNGRQNVVLSGYSGMKKDAAINVVDLAGRCVMQSRIRSVIGEECVRIGIRDLQPGYYVMTIDGYGIAGGFLKR